MSEEEKEAIELLKTLAYIFSVEENLDTSILIKNREIYKQAIETVLEKINPKVINTHDSFNTLEMIIDSDIEQKSVKSDYISKDKIIDQLETNNKKLIEKLEKEKYTIESTYSQINGNYFIAQDRLDLINEILKIVKGEKEY